MSLQDPEFDTFKRAFHEENFDYALHSLKKLIAKYPQSLALRWHQAKVLERLERFGEARSALNKVLELRSDYVPALIMQVQLDFHGKNDDDDDYDVFEEDQDEKEQARFNAIEQRLYKILSIDPKSVDALHMLSGLLRGHEGDAHLVKANQLLNRAISLAPERVDLLEDRANSFLASAIEQDEKNSSTNIGDIATTFSGVSYSRKELEQALADFQRCYELSNQHRYGLRVGSILHDLGRFDEALVAFDKVLAQVSEDDPYRPLILERRARSENNGAGEREHMAQLLEAAVATNGKDRTLEEDNIAHVILGAANAVRSGKSVNDALEARISDDPDDIVVTSIATQILNVANEPHPDLVAVDPKDYPAYQQKFIAKCKRDLTKLGLHHIADAEAQGMRLMLGKSVLLSFFADETGETGVACFSMKAKKPGVVSVLFLLLTGKWKALSTTLKTAHMIECVTQFMDGDHLSTQWESPSPFEYGPPVYLEKLPAKSSAKKLVERHVERLAEHHQQFPKAKALRMKDLAGMEERWIKGQQVKRAYRKQIGFITDTELQGLLGTHYDKYAQKVKTKIEQLAADIH